MSRRTWYAVATAIAFGTALGASGSPAMARDVVVATWGGAYTDARKEANFDPFTAATGISVTPDVYTGGLGKVRAMTETGNVTWDLFQAETEDMTRGCVEGLLEPIDWSKIPDKGDIIPSAISECGIGSVIGPTVLAHDADKLGAELKTWADFWNLKDFPGKRGLRRSPKTTLEAALLADGVPREQLYEVLGGEGGVDRALAKLDEIKDQVLWWEKGAQPREWLASGEVSMTIAFGGRIATAIEEGKNFVIDWPSSFYAISWWSIVKGAPNLDAAYEFLAFTATPEIQAEFSKRWPSGPVNMKAIGHLSPERLRVLPVGDNLSASMEENNEFWDAHIETIDRRFQAWLGQN